MIDSSNFVKTLKDKPVAVFGLGRSGIASVKSLVKSGGRVIAWDDNEDARAKASQAGADVKEMSAAVIGECAYLVLAPGIALDHDIPQTARNAGVEIISDIEILHRSAHGLKTIGVTGTNGKSTTVSLIHHVLQHAGYKSVLGGNIGKAVLECTLPRVKKGENGFFVIELSSYQLEITPTFHPDISVLLNITPDHLDRHGAMENYAQIKSRIFKNTGGVDQGVAVICADDGYTRSIYEDVKRDGGRDIIRISLDNPKHADISVDGTMLRDVGGDHDICNLSLMKTLPGAHNWQNAACAYGALKAAGLGDDEIAEGFKTYPGLAHRQYACRVINGVTYINDSKATNAEATSKALGSYNKIYWIVGGRKKDGGLDGLDEYMPRVKHAFVIGEAASDFSAWLQYRDVPSTICTTLERAVRAAHDMADIDRGEPGGGGSGVVLLSPACASFDQFTSFEARGEVFEKLVKALPES